MRPSLLTFPASRLSSQPISQWSPQAFALLGLGLGILAGFTDGTFCFNAHDQLGFPRTHPHWLDWGPAVLFAVLVYAAHDLLGLASRQGRFTGFLFVFGSVMLAWSLAFGLALFSRRLGLMPSIPATTLAGGLGAGLSAFGISQVWRLPVAREKYILLLALLGAFLGGLYSVLTQLGIPALPNPDAHTLSQRIVGNMLLFTPWEGLFLAVSLMWLRARRQSPAAKVVPE